MIGAEMRMFLSLTKAFPQLFLHSKSMSFYKRLHNDLDIALKSLINLLKKPACLRNDLTSFIDFGVDNFAINSILNLSTSVPFDEIM